MTVSTRPVLTSASTVADILRDYANLDAGIVLEHVRSTLCCPISEALPLLSRIGAEGYAAIPLIEARITAQIKAAMPKQSGQSFSMKVSEKGGISIRGIRGISVKFGLTLYVAAYEDLFSRQDEIKAFIAANNGKLARK